MLKAMRHHARYFYVLFFIVILTFIFWGVGSVDKSSNAEILVEVGKHKITREEYARAYERANRFYQDLYKEKFDEEMQKKLNLKETVLNSLISGRVLLIAAAENGIEVSDEELSAAIGSEPMFMKDGVFDKETYRRALGFSRFTPQSYEAQRRQELTVQKMTRLIELSAAMPETALSGTIADEQTLKSIQDAIRNDAKDKAVRAYVEGYKKKIPIKIYQDLLS